jgi:hypothetical protein
MRSGYSHGYLLCLSFDIIINMIPELLIHAELDVYRDNSLKLQSTSRHVCPLEHIFHESEPANHCFYSLMPGVKLRSSKYAILKPVF